MMQFTECLKNNTQCKPYRAAHINLGDVDREFIAQWLDLENRSLEDNAFLSPNFILPALKYLSDMNDVYIIGVFADASVHNASEERESQMILCGLGIFSYSKAIPKFPFPHLVAYKSIHSFLTGLLIDKRNSEEILKEMLSFIRTTHPRVYGIRFADFPKSGRLERLLRHLSGPMGIHWHEIESKSRAYLAIPVNGNSGKWNQHISRKRRQNYRRALKKLSKMGKVNWHLISSKDINDEHIENFLRLEDSGWKSRKNSSLLSDKDQEYFFREMIKGFISTGNVFFSELRIDDKAIASTCNFRIGKSGFAFKVGYDASLYECSPGIINEMEFLRNLEKLDLSITQIDSGAGEDSFINSYWPDRKSLTAGVFCFNNVAHLTVVLINTLRKIKHTPKSLLKRYIPEQPVES